MKKSKKIKISKEFGIVKLPTGETITHFPCEAPWLNAFGACLINIVGIRKINDVIEVQLADEKGNAYRNEEGKYVWVPLSDIPDEWPQ